MPRRWRRSGTGVCRQGHLGNVPDGAGRARTERSFRTRAARAGRRHDGRPRSTAGRRVHLGGRRQGRQVYVDEASRGTRVAAVLLAGAERQVRAGGHEPGWLAVVAGNEPARRFYAKHGWADEGRVRLPGVKAPTARSHRARHRYTKAL